MTHYERRVNLEARVRAVLNLLYDMGRDEGMSTAQGETPKVLPRPCDGPKYEKWTLMDYLHEMNDEGAEAFMACRKFDREPNRDNRYDAYMEVTDLIVAATSVLAKMGADEAVRQEFLKRVNESNATRDAGRRFK